MNAAALRSALSVKAAAEQLVIVDALQMEAPKTKAMLTMLNALGVNNHSILMVLAEKNIIVQRSANNLPNVKTILSGYVNVRDLLGYDMVLLSKGAVENLEIWLTPSSRSQVVNEVEGTDVSDDMAEEAEA
jgi:large subunit ribosomal protein L4